MNESTQSIKRRSGAARLALSYRRADSQAIAGRIQEALAKRYGDDGVFMDTSDIPFGRNFEEHLGEVLASIDLLVVIIGPNWLGQRSDGPARINDPDDYVRLEVDRALKRGIPILPILVDNVRMPSATDIPDSIAGLAKFNAAPVDSGRNFRPDIDAVIDAADDILRFSGWSRNKTIAFSILASIASLLTAQALAMSVLNPDFSLWALMADFPVIFLWIYLVPATITGVATGLILRAAKKGYGLAVVLGCSTLAYVILSVSGFFLTDREYASLEWIVIWSAVWSIGFAVFYYALALVFRGPRPPFVRRLAGA